MKIHTYCHKHFNIFLPAGKKQWIPLEKHSQKHITPEPNPGPQQKLKASYAEPSLYPQILFLKEHMMAISNNFKP